MNNAHTLVRRNDPHGSLVSAVDAEETGRAAHEAEVVLRCLEAHNGATSAELAQATESVGIVEFGQTLDRWRSTCARRLPGLEDRGFVRAVTPTFRMGRDRRVDPNIAPCAVTKTATGKPLKSLRWFVREAA